MKGAMPRTAGRQMRAAASCHGEIVRGFMELTEMGKGLLYRTGAHGRHAVVNALSVILQYAGDSARKKAVKGLLVLRQCLFLVFFAMAFTATAHAAEAADAAIEAKGFADPQRIYDGRRGTYSAAEAGGGTLTVSRPDGIAAVYIEFDRIPEAWTLTDAASGASAACGGNAFLHEFVDVSALFGSLPRTLTLSFAEGTVIADVYVFSEGEIPDWVQIWEPPCEEADLLLLSTHSDDEQLYFAGVLPYYAVERGVSVQVVYLIQHFQANGRQDHVRPHEQLDGLWTVGIRHYPLISEFPDLYSKSKDREAALSMALAAFEKVGNSYEDFVAFVTECLRRFKPLVAVSHDINGEYGHGAHVLCSAALQDAIVRAADAGQYPDSAEAYGTWEVEKTYLHLYKENPIVMDWDTPFESLGGRTPFEMTQEGFARHPSQHYYKGKPGSFYEWIYGTPDRPVKKASEIKQYSPCLYGLYDTKVGPDESRNDFLENVVTYAERARAAEEAARAEEARLAAEEAKRKAEEEAKRKAEEEVKLKAEEEARLKAEEEAREAERASEAEKAQARRGIWAVAAVLAVCAVAGMIGICRIRRHGRRRRRRK